MKKSAKIAIIAAVIIISALVVTVYLKFTQEPIALQQDIQTKIDQLMDKTKELQDQTTDLQDQINDFNDKLSKMNDTLTDSDKCVVCKESQPLPWYDYRAIFTQIVFGVALAAIAVAIRLKTNHGAIR